MNISEIKKPEDVLEFMKKNIKYGWLDINNEEHIGNMKNFRRMYRTSSMDEILEHNIGTCIEQVYLMHYLLDQISTPNKMYCCRIYEPDDFGDLEAEEHMHCFVLYYKDGKVYQIEHPNFEKIGIYEYPDEKTAIDMIVTYYENRSGGVSRPTTEFYEVKPNITFKEFNNYVNSLTSNVDDVSDINYGKK